MVVNREDQLALCTRVDDTQTVALIALKDEFGALSFLVEDINAIDQNVVWKGLWKKREYGKNY
jgi:hypothetical protein